MAVWRATHPDHGGGGTAAGGARRGAGTRPGGKADRAGGGGRRHLLFHFQPHAADGEAGGGGRRGIRARPLRPRGHSEPSANGGGKAAGRGRAEPAVCGVQRQPGSVRVGLDSEFPGRVPAATRLRPDAVPGRAGDGHRPEDDGHSARLGQDAERTGRCQLPGADPRMGAAARHALPLADVRHSAGDAFEQRAGGFAGGGRLAMAAVFGDAVGGIGQPFVRAAGDVVGNVDVAAFAGVSGDAARYEGGSGSAFSARDQSAHRAWLAVFAAGSGRAGLALLRRGGVQQPQPVVDRDAGYHEIFAAGELAAAAGAAGQRRGGLSAYRRRLCEFYAWGTIR